MKSFIASVAVAVGLLLSLGGAPAHAQNLVVNNCGDTPRPVGWSVQGTVDVNGRACVEIDTSAVGTSNVGGAAPPAGLMVNGCVKQTSYVAPGNGLAAPIPCEYDNSGATGSAVPPGAKYLGVNVGGSLTGLHGCGSSIVYDASTNGSTQLVALGASQVIYICGYTIFAAGTVNVELDYGTGTACATGNNKITPAFQLTAQTGAVDGSPFYRGLKTIASNELCLKTSAGIAVQAIVYYDQY